MLIVIAKFLSGLTPAPVYRIHAVSHQPMKRRVRPVAHACHQTVPHRVEVHVIHVRTVIGFILDEMLPKATLCQMPRSPRRRRTAERRSSRGTAFENEVLIKRSRKAKSASVGGIRITQCRWSVVPPNRIYQTGQHDGRDVPPRVARRYAEPKDCCRGAPADWR